MPIEKTADLVLLLPRWTKQLVAVSVDAILCALAVWLAFALRLDNWHWIRGWQWLAVLGSVGLALPLLAASGLYRVMFRYSGWPDFAAIGRAVIVYGVVYGGVFTLIAIPSIPRTVGLIQPMILFMLLCVVRTAAGYWLSGAYKHLLRGSKKKIVMIYGAGSAGRQLAQALAHSAVKVVGFIEDNPKLQGQRLAGFRIFPPEALPELIVEHYVSDILLAVPSASRQRRNEILEVLRKLPIAVRTLPGLTDLAEGKVTTTDLKEPDVDDLLGREPVEPNPSLLARNVSGKVVLVTGAGGSIGSEICRQVAVSGPSVLLLLETSEPALYHIHQELEHRGISDGKKISLVPLLGSVCDSQRLNAILKVWSVDTIYHAAAFKHVPLVEHNPTEGLRNNVFGTLTVAKAAQAAGVRSFVFISTDKAVRPTNVMGASKRLAEMTLQALSKESSSTCFSMVRFGNVLGSSGSVVPLFRKQIRLGGPITITHEDITRYFMTIPEAAQLVIQAGAMAEGGEVFVLEMGEPVRIIDLARKMIELSGLTVREIGNPDGDIEISITGLRPGEKLYEELLIGDNPEGTDHPRIMKANERYLTWAELEWQLLKMRSAIENANGIEARRLLLSLVAEYQPKDEEADWLHLKKA